MMMQKTLPRTLWKKEFPESWEKRVHEDSAKFIKDLQSSLSQSFVTARSPPMLCTSLKKGQTTIQTGFD